MSISKKSLIVSTLLSVVITSPGIAGTIFPPKAISNCSSGAGVLSWDGNGKSDVVCKTIPVTSCPAGQVVLSSPNGLLCGSPIGACSGTQLLTAKNIVVAGATITGFSCEDVSSHVTIPPCASGSYLAGITNGAANCLPLPGATPAPTPTPSPCGSYTSGQTWAESCQSGYTGSVSKLCTNGTITTTSNNCTAIPSPPPAPAVQIISCVNQVCSGKGPAVFYPVRNGAGTQMSMPTSCVGGSWWVDVSGTNWSDGTHGQASSYCTGGAMVIAGNCARPDGGTFANCPAQPPARSYATCNNSYCVGYNTDLGPSGNAAGTSFRSATCTGAWSIDAQGSNWISLCNGSPAGWTNVTGVVVP